MLVDPSSFDPEAIARLRRFGGDPLLSEMIDLLSVAAPERLALARQALGAGNADGARGAFHALKSSAGQLGAVRVQALCERAEHTAGAGDVAAASAMLAELDSAVADMLNWLASHKPGDV